jgi:hypothetical protein
MKGIVTILFTFLLVGAKAQNKLGSIGQWRAHFDNHSIQHIIKGGDYEIGRASCRERVSTWV